MIRYHIGGCGRWLYTRKEVVTRRYDRDVSDKEGVKPDKCRRMIEQPDSDQTRVHSLRVKKRRVKTAARQGTFTERVVNAWNGLPGKAVAAETVGKFKLELDRYLEVMEMYGYWQDF